MSSILIKGMEMPNEGTVIAVYKIDGKLYATRGLSGRLCPLVPVPPHGDFIDRDKLREKEFIHEGDAYATVMSRDIRNAPTIIPADGNLQSDRANANNSEVIANSKAEEGE